MISIVAEIGKPMHKRLLSLLLPTLLLLVLLVGGTAHAETYWQLVFRYNNSSLELVKADPIPQLSKQVSTPGLESAALRVGYRFDWLDASGQTLKTSTAEMPVGLRSPLTDTEPCRWLIPEQGIVVVRTIGPDPKAPIESIHLSQTSLVNRVPAALAVPPPFLKTEQKYALAQALKNAALIPGPIGAYKIRNTGPDGNRLVIVIMGDGYTAADLSAGTFESAAASLGAALESKSPWDVLFAATNLYRIDIESNQQGADNEIYGVYKDTYLNSSFWVSNIERLLALTGDGYFLAVQAADNLVGPGVWDVILVLVNSTKYGGSGGGSIAVSSVHSAASEIVVHELGHSLADLADEYESAYPGFPPGDSEPNVDYDYSGPGLKWLAWVDPGTPLPTPEVSPYLDVVGAFEGARYLTTGIYRPWYNCEMRSLNRPFCPVCQEAHVISFTGKISLADSVLPPVYTSENIDNAGVQFSAWAVPMVGIEYRWSLDGMPVPDAAGPNLLLTPDLMAIHNQTLRLDVILSSPLVRERIISNYYTWPVHATVSLCCTGIVGDANFDGAYEPTIGDISTIIDHLFLSGAPLTCYEEADANQSGGVSPSARDITIGDISTLIDYLFITGTPLPSCF